MKMNKIKKLLLDVLIFVVLCTTMFMFFIVLERSQLFRIYVAYMVVVFWLLGVFQMHMEIIHWDNFKED